MNDWKWELVAKQDSLTEGPAWDGSALLYSHCDASRTWRYDPASGENSVWRENTNGSNGMTFDRRGRLFACEGKGRRVVIYKAGSPAEVVADRFNGKPFNEPNDLAVDDHGRVWFSDPNYGGRPLEQPTESVYRADPGGRTEAWSVTRAASDTVRPNGVLLSLDQRTLYVADSPRELDSRRQLLAYPILNDGSLGDREVLHDFGWGRGIDGMTLTDEGLIIATAGHRERGPGPMLYLFDPSGRVISTHTAPADRPTNCTFAEAGLTTLYVTFGGGEVYRAPNVGHRGHLAYPHASG